MVISLRSLLYNTLSFSNITHLSSPDCQTDACASPQRGSIVTSSAQKPAAADAMKQFDKADPSSLLSQMQRRSSPAAKESRDNSPNLTHSIKGLWGSWTTSGSASVGHQTRVVYPGTWNQALTLSRS